MIINLSIRIPGETAVKGSVVAATLRSLATDFEKDAVVYDDVDYDYGLKDADGHDHVWVTITDDEGNTP